ncbi:MAG TPA: exodeoxyribonuclease VII large subunit [Chloroflexota bacterium]|nr:exodeoxyribonuclease VII large subunit [Chloroflexota bacterium]
MIPLVPLVLSVSEATGHIKSLLEDDSTLADCWVRGEVSDPRTYASGHTYFTLRDGESQLKCVLFKQKARGLEKLEHGRQYIVHGSVGVYEANGVYQFYVTDHRPLGVGELYQQFELLKSKLEADGLFATERKRPLPVWPKRIGIATSPQGAVIHDLKQVIGRRFPLVEVVLAPCQVQGAPAVPTIVASLQALQRAGCDVIVVARGGGSIEDLWAYNDEAVARAIAACGVPVVSAVGHETDFTIADFVADVRAATPSVAGELLVPDAAELRRQLASLTTRAERAVQAQLWTAQSDLVERAAALKRHLAMRLERADSRLTALNGRLAALSPLSVLARGYAVARDAVSGAVVRSVSEVCEGQELSVLVADGTLAARVSSVTRSAHYTPNRLVTQDT